MEISEIMDGVVFVDADAKITMINPVAEDLLRTQRVMVVGKTVEEIQADSQVIASLMADHPVAAAEHRESTRTVEVHYGEMELEYVRVECSPVLSHKGAYSGALFVLRNVTSEHKEDQLKNQYLSIVAHELRTPLTGIKTFSTMLCQGAVGELTENQVDVIESIREQSVRLEHQIDKLINLGFIDTKEYQQDVEVLDVVELLSSSTAPFEAVAKDRNIVIGLHVDGLQDVKVAADRSDLRRSLQALIENAVKFTQDGGRVDVEAVVDGENVEFAVRDSGLGIDPRYHKRIFEKFFQVEDPLTRHHGGAGLGLFVADGVLSAHGSSIEVESSLGNGASFIFRLPKYDEETDRAREGADLRVVEPSVPDTQAANAE